MASGPHDRCMHIVTYAMEPGDTGRLGMARCDKTLHNPRGVHAKCKLQGKSGTPSMQRSHPLP